MKTITLEQANQDLIAYVNYTLDTHEEVNISSSNGAITILYKKTYKEHKWH